MKALAVVVLVLGCVGCSGAVDGIGSAHGGDPTKGAGEGGDAQTAVQGEAGPTDEASAADAGGYCFAAGAMCDPAKGAEPGIACCEGFCSATTGLCSVPTDGGVAHKDASPPDAGSPTDDAGFWTDASSPDCDAATCSLGGTMCVNDQAAGCQPDEAALQAGAGKGHPGTVAFACTDSALLPSFVWSGVCFPVGVGDAGSGVCCPPVSQGAWTLCSSNECHALGTCR